MSLLKYQKVIHFGIIRFLNYAADSQADKQTDCPERTTNRVSIGNDGTSPEYSFSSIITLSSLHFFIYLIETINASRFDWNSNRMIPIRFNSKVTGRFKIFESATPAVVPQITLTVQQKTSTVAPL